MFELNAYSKKMQFSCTLEIGSGEKRKLFTQQSVCLGSTACGLSSLFSSTRLHLTTQDAAPRFHMHVCAYPKQLAWIGMQVLAARKWCLIMHVIWMPQLCARWASKIFPHIDCFTHWFIVNLFLHECSVQHVQWVCE